MIPRVLVALLLNVAMVFITSAADGAEIAARPLETQRVGIFLDFPNPVPANSSFTFTVKLVSEWTEAIPFEMLLFHGGDGFDISETEPPTPSPTSDVLSPVYDPTSENVMYHWVGTIEPQQEVSLEVYTKSGGNPGVYTLLRAIPAFFGTQVNPFRSDIEIVEE